MNREIVRTLMTAAVVAASFQANAAMAQNTSNDPPQRTIRVSGVGEATAEPDLATVQFGVETTGLTAQEAGQANAALMERLIQAFRTAGVGEDDIRTSGYGLYPEYEIPSRGGENDPPRIRGYRATNQISVRTTDLERVGRLIDVGLEAGANQMHGVQFELRNSAAAEAEALGNAVGQARTAAETIARTLGVQLGEVLDASTSAQLPQPMYRMEARDMAGNAAMAMAPSTPIEPGEQTVRATASIVFAIE